MPRLAFIGRFNGPKGERAAALLQHVFPPLLAENPQLRVALIGGEMEQLPDAGKTALAGLQSQYGERVEVVGFTDDVAGWLLKTDLVIGAGRVVMEALGVGRAVLALGEALYVGPVTLENYAEAAASNFGDISARLGGRGLRPRAAAGRRAGLSGAAAPGSTGLAALVRHDYDLARVAARVLGVYESARMARGRARVYSGADVPQNPGRSAGHRAPDFCDEGEFCEAPGVFQKPKFQPHNLPRLPGFCQRPPPAGRVSPAAHYPHL
ncbi:MAG: glycosyltransferase [Hymenobacter sp.]